MRSASATEVPPNFITSRATASRLPAGVSAAWAAAPRPRSRGRLPWCPVPSRREHRQRAGRAGPHGGAAASAKEPPAPDPGPSRRHRRGRRGRRAGHLHQHSGGSSKKVTTSSSSTHHGAGQQHDCGRQLATTATTATPPTAAPAVRWRPADRRHPVPKAQRPQPAVHHLQVGPAQLPRPGQDLHRHVRDHRGQHRGGASTPPRRR